MKTLNKQDLVELESVLKELIELRNSNKHKAEHNIFSLKHYDKKLESLARRNGANIQRYPPEGIVYFIADKTVQEENQKETEHQKEINSLQGDLKAVAQKSYENEKLNAQKQNLKHALKMAPLIFEHYSQKWKQHLRERIFSQLELLEEYLSPQNKIIVCTALIDASNYLKNMPIFTETERQKFLDTALFSLSEMIEEQKVNQK